MIPAMNCKEIKKLLDEYPDGELSPEESETVRAHLLQCPECRAEWLLEKQLRDDISAAAPEVPADLHEHIMEAVRKEQSVNQTTRVPNRRSSRFGNRFRALVAIAATFVLIGTVALTATLTLTHRKNQASGSFPESDLFFSESFSMKANPNYSGLHPDEAPEMTTSVTNGTVGNKDEATVTELSLTKGQHVYRIVLAPGAENQVLYTENGVTFTGDFVWQGSTLRLGFIGGDGQIYESFWDGEGTYLSGMLPWEAPQ